MITIFLADIVRLRYFWQILYMADIVADIVQADMFVIDKIALINVAITYLMSHHERIIIYSLSV